MCFASNFRLMLLIAAFFAASLCFDLEFVHGDEEDSCNAFFRNGAWVITTDCSEDCYCNVPPIVGGGSVVRPGKFLCLVSSSTNATSEKFFLLLSKPGTNDHYQLVFDKSELVGGVDTKFFEGFNAEVIGIDGKTQWKIKAKWNDTATSCMDGPTISAENSQPRKGHATLINDTRNQGDVRSTSQYAEKETRTCGFGHWELEITYLP